MTTHTTVGPTPVPQDKFSFGLWTVAYGGRDPFGEPTRADMDPVYALERLADLGAYGVGVGLAVRGVLALELAEGGRVEVEPLDAHPDLVGPQLGAGVEPLGGLRQHGSVVEDAVQAERGGGPVSHGKNLPRDTPEPQILR